MDNKINLNGYDMSRADKMTLRRNLKTASSRRNAIKVLFGSKDSSKTDNVSVSKEGKQFTKQSLLQMVSKSKHTSVEDVSFYLKNFNNPQAILDAINFGSEAKNDYNPDFKEHGVISFYHNNRKQIVPSYAVSKINPNSLEKMQAKDNSLTLSNKSYYSYTTQNGKKFSMTVKAGNISWAASEKLLTESNRKEEKELETAGNILSALAQGKDCSGYKGEDILSALKSVGIEEGPFTIDAGAGKHSYILKEDGQIVKADEKEE